MKRRDFFRNIAPLGLLGVPTSRLTLRMPDDYHAFGHLRAGDEFSYQVDYITLDGKRVDRVHELDDIEGWLRRYPVAADLEKMTAEDYYPLVKEFGVVRLHWRKPE